jgi:MoaA/NifB/PqqE/SkfB family radical SAM enzyme
MIVEFDLVNWCTLQCIGCESLNKKHANELDYDIAFDYIKDLDIKEIMICGDAGEPLLHARVTDFIVRCATLTSNVLVNTNCEDISNLNLNKLKLDNVIYEVAVDGITTEMHQYTRRGADLNMVLDNAEILINAGLNVKFISTRHKNNEKYSKAIYDMLYNRFDKEVLFRDTNEIGRDVEQPTVPSNTSDVSVWYKDLKFTNRNVAKLIYKVKPDKDYRYIRNDNKMFPCFGFSNINVPDMPYDKLCSWYQENGDIRTCIYNCGKVQNGFRYDTLDEIQ